MGMSVLIEDICARHQAGRAYGLKIDNAGHRKAPALQR